MPSHPRWTIFWFHQAILIWRYLETIFLIVIPKMGLHFFSDNHQPKKRGSKTGPIFETGRFFFKITIHPKMGLRNGHYASKGISSTNMGLQNRSVQRSFAQPVHKHMYQALSSSSYFSQHFSYCYRFAAISNYWSNALRAENEIATKCM